MVQLYLESPRAPNTISEGNWSPRGSTTVDQKLKNKTTCYNPPYVEDLDARVKKMGWSFSKEDGTSMSTVRIVGFSPSNGFSLDETSLSSLSLCFLATKHLFLLLFFSFLRRFLASCICSAIFSRSVAAAVVVVVACWGAGRDALGKPIHFCFDRETLPFLPTENPPEVVSSFSSGYPPMHLKKTSSSTSRYPCL